MTDINECVIPKYGRLCGACPTLINGWKYKSLETLKLKTTKMWLGRRAGNSSRINGNEKYYIELSGDTDTSDSYYDYSQLNAYDIYEIR